AVGNGLKPFPTHGLSEMIRGFKTFSSRKINEGIKNNHNFQWQKSFYDHVIRSENELSRIREYTQNNPLKWELDIENMETSRCGKNSKDYYKEIIVGR
ncbi:MAG: hypothetical protein FJ115_12845, partial [Deltaproteobacteria bacterium]|nr:hypothetical protein [Deltaproteobacteria bacterium]